MASNSAFPSIGTLADKAEAIEDKQANDQVIADQDEERPLEEIDSLCMSCGEQVSFYPLACYMLVVSPVLTMFTITGSDSDDAHLYTLF
jgi:hypothetical protein